jgi:hypothetical protein
VRVPVAGLLTNSRNRSIFRHAPTPVRRPDIHIPQS